jgi:hypothetical protein
LKPRYLRFARTLALVTTGTAGCDGGALFAPDASRDAANEATSDATGDATLDGGHLDAHDAYAGGACRVVALDAARDLPCPEGFACSFPDDLEGPRCTLGFDAAGEAGENVECGVITCAEYCYCAGPAASVCGCFHGPTGPLSPPDLPRGTLRLDGRPLPALRPRARPRQRRRKPRL